MTNQLTDYEISGLSGKHNFSDGHAYHDIEEIIPRFPRQLTSIWKSSESTGVKKAEQRFKSALANLINSPSLMKTQNFRITPTASNSIDLVAAYLAEHASRVLLVEPTFDNLSLLLKRRGCSLLPIADTDLAGDGTAQSIDDILGSFAFDTLFLVSPNNPTGTVISAARLQEIAEYCSHAEKKIVIDSTFRFYAEAPYDERLVLERANCEHIIIEDTGKTWPTHDLKCSLTSYHIHDKYRLERIFDEVYLCHSRFALLIFESLFNHTKNAGISDIIHRPMAIRHTRLTDAVAHLGLTPLINRHKAPLPFEWFELDNRIYDSEDHFLQIMNQRGIHALPGKHFYWSDMQNPSCRVRFSMARPLHLFDQNIVALKAVSRPGDRKK